jgi:hypothetical protein
MNEINEALEFDKLIQAKPDRELLEFIAHQNYDTCQRCASHDSRITALESSNKKTSSLAGGITGTIAGIVVGLISYFAPKG